MEFLLKLIYCCIKLSSRLCVTDLTSTFIENPYGTKIFEQNISHTEFCWFNHETKVIKIKILYSLLFPRRRFVFKLIFLDFKWTTYITLFHCLSHSKMLGCKSTPHPNAPTSLTPSKQQYFLVSFVKFRILFMVFVRRILRYR